MKKKSSQGLPALIFLAILGGGAYLTLFQKEDLPPSPTTSKENSASTRKNQPTASLSHGSNNSSDKSAESLTSEPSRGRLAPPDEHSASSVKKTIPSSPPVSQDPSPLSDSAGRSLEQTIANTHAQTPKSVSDDIESQLGTEKAAEYRFQEQRAFRAIDEEDDKKELEGLTTSLGLSANQDTSIGLVYDESRAAFAQQQETFRRQAAEKKAEEKLEAITQLARFREQFIYDRMKSILTPEQMIYYADSLAQQEFEKAEARKRENK